MVKFLTILLTLALPCVGMIAVFLVYMCLLWFAAYTQPPVPVKRVSDKGLKASDLEKLPKTSGKELTRAAECALCLDDIEAEQPARVLPGCKHGFHLQLCVDTWLSKRSFCRVCRAQLQPPKFLSSSDEIPC